MSVRAYKITKLEVEETPTFNCWRDDFIFDLFPWIGDNGGQFISLSEEDIDNVNPKILKTLTQDERDIFDKIKKAATQDPLGYVRFICY